MEEVSIPVIKKNAIKLKKRKPKVSPLRDKTQQKAPISKINNQLKL